MDLTQLHKNGKAQVMLGLLFGIAFGFLLQKGGATSYEVIIGQLLLTDFTVLKVMASAVATGLVGFFLLKHYGYAKRHVKAATIGSNVVGGLIFGLGFGLLGYCPGTVAGAVGRVPLMPCLEELSDFLSVPGYLHGHIRLLIKKSSITGRSKRRPCTNFSVYRSG